MRLFFLLLFSFAIVLLDSCSSGNDSINEQIPEVIQEGNVKKTESANEEDTSRASEGFRIEPYFPLHHQGGAHQGSAVYGDYLFEATAQGLIHVYNFREKQYVNSLEVEIMGHADTMCFGIQKVEESDEFPVLYISGSQATTTGRGGDVYVYRMLRTEGDETGSEEWSAKLVQHIVTPDVYLVGNYPDVVIDADNQRMWIMGWFSQYLYDQEDGSGCFNCFSWYEIPDIRDGIKDENGVYQLSMTDMDMQGFFLLHNMHAITQGLCFYQGKIFCPYGGTSDVLFKGIDVVDVERECIVEHVDLNGTRIVEPESFVIYNDEFFVLGQADFVYKCLGLNINGPVNRIDAIFK